MNQRTKDNIFLTICILILVAMLILIGLVGCGSATDITPKNKNINVIIDIGNFPNEEDQCILDHNCEILLNFKKRTFNQLRENVYDK